MSVEYLWKQSKDRTEKWKLKVKIFKKTLLNLIVTSINIKHHHFYSYCLKTKSLCQLINKIKTEKHSHNIIKSKWNCKSFHAYDVIVPSFYLALPNKKKLTDTNSNRLKWYSSFNQQKFLWCKFQMFHLIKLMANKKKQEVDTHLCMVTQQCVDPFKCLNQKTTTIN